MEILGKTPINPILFFTGKIGGYVTWVFAITEAINNGIKNLTNNHLQMYTVIVLIFLGSIFLVMSSIYLGNNVRIGIPQKETKLKTTGIYKISRNPMYIGLNLITLSSIVFTLNIIVVILGLYSIYVYHLIIKSEEFFLYDRFGDEYSDYTKMVRRYF